MNFKQRFSRNCVILALCTGLILTPPQRDAHAIVVLALPAMPILPIALATVAMTSVGPIYGAVSAIQFAIWRANPGSPSPGSSHHVCEYTAALVILCVPAAILFGAAIIFLPENSEGAIELSPLSYDRKIFYDDSLRAMREHWITNPTSDLRSLHLADLEELSNDEVAHFNDPSQRLRLKLAVRAVIGELAQDQDIRQLAASFTRSLRENIPVPVVASEQERRWILKWSQAFDHFRVAPETRSAFKKLALVQTTATTYFTRR